MNNRFTKQSILIGIIIILAAIIVSIIVTIIYHVKETQNNMEATSNIVKEGELQNFNGRYFRDKLRFSGSQMEQFRELNPRFRRKAMEISHRLSLKRMDLLTEMQKGNADTAKMNQISSDIGKLHAGLKIATYQYYFDLKNICNKEQVIMLDKAFQEMFQFDNQTTTPGKGYRRMNRFNN